MNNVSTNILAIMSDNITPTSISSRKTVTKVLKVFKAKHDNTLRYESRRSSLLFKAMTDNNTELIKLILDYRHYDMDCFECATGPLPRPLFYAIQISDVELIKELLMAGSSATSKSPFLDCYKREDTWPILTGASITALEYACLMERPDLVGLLASYSTYTDDGTLTWY